MTNYQALRRQLNSQPLVRCSACGLRFRPTAMEIHHNDGNRQNDDPANHRVLCKRCHKQRTNLQRSA